MATSSNIVVEWLRSLHLGQYAESFLDNGYDDLEICKQVGDPDLDAIGVFNQAHRGRLLGSVRALREEGAASVYFSLEETVAAAAALNMAFHDDMESGHGSGMSSRNSSATGRPASESDREGNAGCGRPGPGSGPGSGSGSRGGHAGPQGHSPAPSSAGSNHELGKYLDEYEEGKAELVRLPRSLLRKLLREKLLQDGIRLCHQPYSTSDGERGYLDGLASRYADLYRTHYADVLEHLELQRRREWADMSPRIRVLGMESPRDSPRGSPRGSPTSQPIYVPGKYSPSSCLSDREEDEIYGLAGAGRQPQPQPAQPAGVHAGYQTCLSPRAAYFYELPPNEAARGKKRTALSRLLRGLKSKGRTARRGGPALAGPHMGHATLGPHMGHGPHPGLTLQHCSPRRDAHRAQQIYARVTTPDGDSALVPQFLDLREYDRLLHMNGGGGPGAGAGAAAAGPRGPQADFEETIHRLKLQDAIRQKERYHREHEEILRDIRQGLLRLDPQTRLDDTYMYDTELMASSAGPSGGQLSAGHPGGGGGAAGALGALHLGHWYDEPPYESDPEDFLMSVPGAAGGPGAIMQNGRACLTLNLRPAAVNEAVISLQSAGDISLGPRAQSGAVAGALPHGMAGMRLVSLQRRGRGRGQRPGQGQAQGARGRSGSRSRPGPGPGPAQGPGLAQGQPQADQRGSCSDVHNMSSHLSALSIGYPWDQQQVAALKKQQYRCRSSQSEGTLSPCRSPDLIETQTESQPRSTSLVGRMKGLRQDVQRKISRLRGLAGSSNNNPSSYREQSEQAIPLERLPAASSMESLPSGSGSSTQALVRDGSNESSLSPIASHEVYHTIGKARALVDYNPSPYDRDALKFKKGDIIEILAMSPSGMWRGRLNGNVGFFKFINVEVIPGSVMLSQQTTRGHLRGRPNSVDELLRRVNLEECISVFILNGYEDIESFKDLREEDLDYLGIKSTEIRAKIRAAIRLLHDYDCTTDNSNGESDSGGEDEDEDEDDEEGEEEYDSSSGSDLGLGQGQGLGRAPQPLPLSGKFPPGLLHEGHGGGDGGGGRTPRGPTRAAPKGRRSSPPAPAPAPTAAAPSYHPNIPVAGGVGGGTSSTTAATASIESYVVARKGGKGVTVEAGPRAGAGAGAVPPLVLPRTGSTSSSSSSVRPGRGRPAAPSPGAGTPTGAGGSPTAGHQELVGTPQLAEEPHAHGLNGVHPHGPAPGLDQAAPSSTPGSGAATVTPAAHVTNANVSERSSDSGVSSSSSQPSSRESDSRRGNRTGAAKHPQTSC